jgi:hypothetical protein
MPAVVREARIAALEAELSALRGDSRRKVYYDHNEPLEDPYAHTGVDPWGGWRTGRESYRRDLERMTYRDLLVAVLARLEGLEQRTTSRRP